MELPDDCMAYMEVLLSDLETDLHSLIVIRTETKIELRKLFLEKLIREVDECIDHINKSQAFDPLTHDTLMSQVVQTLRESEVESALSSHYPEPDLTTPSAPTPPEPEPPELEWEPPTELAEIREDLDTNMTSCQLILNNPSYSNDVKAAIETYVIQYTMLDDDGSRAAYNQHRGLLKATHAFIEGVVKRRKVALRALHSHSPPALRKPLLPSPAPLPYSEPLPYEIHPSPPYARPPSPSDPRLPSASVRTEEMSQMEELEAIMTLHSLRTVRLNAPPTIIQGQRLIALETFGASLETAMPDFQEGAKTALPIPRERCPIQKPSPDSPEENALLVLGQTLEVLERHKDRSNLREYKRTLDSLIDVSKLILSGTSNLNIVNTAIKNNVELNCCITELDTVGAEEPSFASPSSPACHSAAASQDAEWETQVASESPPEVVDGPKSFFTVVNERRRSCGETFPENTVALAQIFAPLGFSVVSRKDVKMVLGKEELAEHEKSKFRFLRVPSSDNADKDKDQDGPSSALGTSPLSKSSKPCTKASSSGEGKDSEGLASPPQSSRGNERVEGNGDDGKHSADANLEGQKDSKEKRLSKRFEDPIRIQASPLDLTVRTVALSRASTAAGKKSSTHTLCSRVRDREQEQNEGSRTPPSKGLQKSGSSPKEKTVEEVLRTLGKLTSSGPILLTFDTSNPPLLPLSPSLQAQDCITFHPPKLVNAASNVFPKANLPSSTNLAPGARNQHSTEEEENIFVTFSLKPNDPGRRVVYGSDAASTARSSPRQPDISPDSISTSETSPKPTKKDFKDSVLFQMLTSPERNYDVHSVQTLKLNLVTELGRSIRRSLSSEFATTADKHQDEMQTGNTPATPHVPSEWDVTQLLPPVRYMTEHVLAARGPSDLWGGSSDPQSSNGKLGTVQGSSSNLGDRMQPRSPPLRSDKQEATSTPVSSQEELQEETAQDQEGGDGSTSQKRRRHISVDVQALLSTKLTDASGDQGAEATDRQSQDSISLNDSGDKQMLIPQFDGNADEVEDEEEGTNGKLPKKIQSKTTESRLTEEPGMTTGSDGDALHGEEEKGSLAARRNPTSGNIESDQTPAAVRLQTRTKRTKAPFNTGMLLWMEDTIAQRNDDRQKSGNATPCSKRVFSKGPAALSGRGRISGETSRTLSPSVQGMSEQFLVHPLPSQTQSSAKCDNESTEKKETLNSSSPIPSTCSCAKCKTDSNRTETPEKKNTPRPSEGIKEATNPEKVKDEPVRRYTPPESRFRQVTFPEYREADYRTPPQRDRYKALDRAWKNNALGGRSTAQEDDVEVTDMEWLNNIADGMRLKIQGRSADTPYHPKRPRPDLRWMNSKTKPQPEWNELPTPSRPTRTVFKSVTARYRGFRHQPYSTGITISSLKSPKPQVQEEKDFMEELCSLACRLKFPSTESSGDKKESAEDQGAPPTDTSTEGQAAQDGGDGTSAMPTRQDSSQEQAGSDVGPFSPTGSSEPFKMPDTSKMKVLRRRETPQADAGGERRSAAASKDARSSSFKGTPLPGRKSAARKMGTGSQGTIPLDTRVSGLQEEEDSALRKTSTRTEREKGKALRKTSQGEEEKSPRGGKSFGSPTLRTKPSTGSESLLGVEAVTKHVSVHQWLSVEHRAVSVSASVARSSSAHHSSESGGQLQKDMPHDEEGRQHGEKQKLKQLRIDSMLKSRPHEKEGKEHGEKQKLKQLRIDSMFKSQPSQRQSGQSAKASRSNIDVDLPITPPAKSNIGVGLRIIPPAKSSIGAGFPITPPAKSNIGARLPITPPAKSNIGARFPIISLAKSNIGAVLPITPPAKSRPSGKEVKPSQRLEPPPLTAKSPLKTLKDFFRRGFSPKGKKTEHEPSSGYGRKDRGSSSKERKENAKPLIVHPRGSARGLRVVKFAPAGDHLGSLDKTEPRKRHYLSTSSPVKVLPKMLKEDVASREESTF